MGNASNVMKKLAQVLWAGMQTVKNVTGFRNASFFAESEEGSQFI
jgi:hypothetical protein